MRKPKKRGRPAKDEPKFTPENCRDIITMLSVGVSLERTAKHVNVDRATIWRWVKRGQTEPKGPYHGFARDYRRAIGLLELRCLAIIDKAAQNGNWTAAAWKLERLFPERYGRQVLEHKGIPDEFGLKITFEGLLSQIRASRVVPVDPRGRGQLEMRNGALPPDDETESLSRGVDCPAPPRSPK